MIDLPITDTFVRYAKRRHLISNNDNKTYTISSSNFFLREDQNEIYVSGIWYEFLQPRTDDDGLNKLTQYMAKKYQKISGAFSLHNVESIIANSDADTTFSVRQIEDNNAHAGIYPNPRSLHYAEIIASTVNKVLLCN